MAAGGMMMKVQSEGEGGMKWCVKVCSGGSRARSGDAPRARGGRGAVQVQQSCPPPAIPGPGPGTAARMAQKSSPGPAVRPHPATRDGGPGTAAKAEGRGAGGEKGERGWRGGGGEGEEGQGWKDGEEEKVE